MSMLIFIEKAIQRQQELRGQETCVCCNVLLDFPKDLSLEDPKRWAEGALYMSPSQQIGELMCGQYCSTCGGEYRRANAHVLFGNTDEHGRF